MKEAALAASVVLAASFLSGCALPAARDRTPAPASAAAAPCVPDFASDGRVRRDPATAAPVFLAGTERLRERAPRFDAEGRVDRDPETGAPVYEEVAAGVVVRVLVALP